ncbi:2'-5' RNA ligase family protein [Pseudarthrobacter sp. NamB4]|uniref:2'-5' RNA ligase family protein n=1 Tax=Pseudarthrobacter sp. NamB4 TaxID=2576837 RepID=UPI0010FE3202|nr:2'-5' RNA ligase family protein [Pseudarthrobacter sp. NamB4]TLM75471.1 2'-5' RNA ligase family protein [Pseudarthrobacter sp. NamB4]
MHSIELTFEDSTDKAIRSDWARLAAAGVPSLAIHTSPSNSPHITLAAGPELRLPTTLKDLWQRLPVDIDFSGVQVFGARTGTYVLARSIVVTRPLLELHRLLHEEISGALPLTRPGAWTPHVTLARRIYGHQLGTALDLLDLRMEGVCTRARLWDSGTRTLTPLADPA